MRGLFERINILFGDWYERLFGAGGELHPREVLRRLVIAAEEHRIEGLDGELYVPNRYKLEIALQNPEEQEAYLTFLQPQDLADALWQELQEEGYRLRGGIVCEVVAQPAPSGGTPRQALRITARFDPSIPLPMVLTPSPEEVTNVASAPATTTTDVASDVGAGARAVLKSEDGKVLIHLANRPIVLGRSQGAGCDLVLEADRQISRRHARIEWDSISGNYIIYDLQSTNGLFVNESRVDNTVLRSGDRIRLGKTVLIFESFAQPSSQEQTPIAEMVSVRPPARLIVHPDTAQEEIIPLPGEALIGRALTADICLQEADVSMRHAVIRWNGKEWQIEDVGSASGTTVNDTSLSPHKPITLHSGDIIRIGSVTLRIDIEDTP
ncbi:MAG: FhaA domain-containing protein [Armatimonadota bacterium]